MRSAVSLCVLLVLAVLPCVFADPDYRLINDSYTNAKPIWTRTTVGSQPAPVDYSTSQDWADYDNPPKTGGADPYAALLWGNTFTIRNVRVRNDTDDFVARRKRLDPTYHFAIENQTIAMNGQEYLLRPRAFSPSDASLLSKKRAIQDEMPWNGQFHVYSGAPEAVQVLNVTPAFATFRLTNSSDPDTETVAFFDSETINSAGASFTLWASNPSAIPWFGPGWVSFNVSDANSPLLSIPPFGAIDIEWLVACRWISNGSDCGDDLAEFSSELCALKESVGGSQPLCWSRINVGGFRIESLDEGSPSYTDYSDTDDGYWRNYNWGIYVAPRPLTLWSPSSDQFAHVNPWYLEGSKRGASPEQLEEAGNLMTVDVKSNKDTPAFIVGLPLNDAPVAPDDLDDFTANGTTSNDWLRRFLPGKDNTGGTLEISVKAIVEIPDGSNPNQVSRVVSHIQMVPSKVVISKDQPTASFYFTNITKPLGVSQYCVHFQVSESSPSTITISNSSAALGDVGGIYYNGAYSIPVLALVPQPYDFELRNFPPGDGNGAIQMPIMPEALFNCSAASNAFVAQLGTSPASIGQSSIAVPFNITPAGALKFWTCPGGGGAGGKRQTTPTQISSFQFTGTTSTVLFYVTTQGSPVSGVTLGFGTPVLSNAVLIDPITGFNFAQNGTYTFDVTQNEVHVDITNDAGSGSDEATGGPFVNQDFYMQFQWTPATRNGFSIAVTGLYTSYPSNAVVSNSGLTATFSVPAGSTGFLAGPFRASSPNNLSPTDETFDILYSVSLLPAAGGASSDNTWYRLADALTAVTISRHRFAIMNWDGDSYELLSTGQKSQPFCVGTAFAGALGTNDTVWLTVTADWSGGQPLIFEPVTAVAGARPPNALLLSAANPVSCFTARFDTNWQFLNDGTGRAFSDLSDIFINGAILSGPSATTYRDQQYLANAPSFDVVKPKVHMKLAASALTGQDDEFMVGETALLWVWVDVLPPTSFSYNVSFSGGRVSALSTGAGTFSASSTMQQLWQVSFDVLPVSAGGADHAEDNSNDLWSSVLQVVGYGADAVFYDFDDDASIDVDVSPRFVKSFPNSGIPNGLTIDYSLAYFPVMLSAPAVNGLTVTPWARNNGGAAGASSSGGLRFTPASYTFSANSSLAVRFQATGVLLGSWSVGFSLSGPDQNLFRWEGSYVTDGFPDQSVLPAQNVQRKSFTIQGAYAYSAILAGDDSTGNSYYQYVRVGGVPPADGSSSRVQLDDVTFGIDCGSDVTITPNVFPMQDVVGRLHYRILWQPAQFGPGSETRRCFNSISGPDAWKYEVPASSWDLPLQRRLVDVTFAAVDSHVVGVRYSGRVELPDGPAPEGASVWLLAGNNVQFYLPGATTASNSAQLPFIVTFAAGGASVFEFEYVVSSPVSSSLDEDFDPSPAAAKDVQVNILLDSSFAGNRYFALSDVSPVRVLAVTRRAFQVDMFGSSNNNALPNPAVKNAPAAFMVNHESPLYTVVVTAPPINSVTLTLSHPALTFNGGQNAATLVFTPGQLSATFSFVPISIPDSGLDRFVMNVAVSGPDAALYDANPVIHALKEMVVLPELGFSPIPPIYADGSAVGLKVWLVDALAQGFSYSAHNAFTLELSTGQQSGVYVEPSVLHFSPSSLQANRLSQEFSIHHISPSSLTGDSYELSWSLRVEGLADGSAYSMNNLIPADAQRVIVRRYQIIPEFPERLNFGWQRASINVSRAPVSHMTLIPHGPHVDGQASDAYYGGAHTAGGQLVFEPPTVVFSPGQQVAHFHVKAIAGSDQNAVYYRVQWQLDGQYDDLYCYLDYFYSRNDAGGVSSHFATWHVASGALLQLSLAVLLATIAVLLL